MQKQGWVLRSGLTPKTGARIATIACCVLMSACGPTSPSATTLDGQWSGTTSQGTPIAFTVSSDQKVTAITVAYSFNGCSGTQTFSNLNLDTAPMVTCIPGPCTPPISSFHAFNYVTGSIDGPSTAVNGVFPAPGRAEGLVTFRDYPGCGTAAAIAWSAGKR